MKGRASPALGCTVARKSKLLSIEQRADDDDKMKSDRRSQSLELQRRLNLSNVNDHDRALFIILNQFITTVEKKKGLSCST
mmetsp:Transcript_27768/g.84773  ORF Transcript_27768/g.84773 Transcript_27768/m.84773 type:complete len:81 (-) Transcript_27768:529-771(-)